jgi:hypothetical protein
MKKNSQTIKTNTYYQGCPEGGVGGVAPLGNFVGKNIKGGTKGKIGRSLPPPPPWKISSGKNLKGKI